MSTGFGLPSKETVERPADKQVVKLDDLSSDAKKVLDDFERHINENFSPNRMELDRTTSLETALSSSSKYSVSVAQKIERELDKCLAQLGAIRPITFKNNETQNTPNMYKQLHTPFSEAVADLLDCKCYQKACGDGMEYLIWGMADNVKLTAKLIELVCNNITKWAHDSASTKTFCDYVVNTIAPSIRDWKEKEVRLAGEENGPWASTETVSRYRNAIAKILKLSQPTDDTTGA